MAHERQTNFGSGEIAPSWHSRTDLPQYGTAVKACRNFFGTKFGTLLNRSGTRYASRAQSDSLTSRLFTFNFSDDQQYVIEVSAAGTLSVKTGSGSATGVPRYLVAIRGSTATKTFVARTQAPAEDPTGTWTKSDELVSGAYVQVSNSDNGIVVMTAEYPAYFAVSTDYGVTFTEYAHGLTNFVAHSLTFARSARTGDSAGAFYVAGRNAVTGYLAVYRSTTGLAGSWSALTFGTSVLTPTTTCSRAVIYAWQDGVMLVVFTTSTAITAAHLSSPRPDGTRISILAYLGACTAYNKGFDPFMHRGYLMVPFGVSADTCLLALSLYNPRFNALIVTGLDLGGGVSAMASNGSRIVVFGSVIRYSDDGGYTWATAAAVGPWTATRALWFRDRFVIAGQDTNNSIMYTAPADTLVVTAEYTAYDSGGVAGQKGMGAVLMPAQPFTFAVPWSVLDLPKLQMFQSGDWCYFTCPGYPVQVLKRSRTASGNMAWTLSNYFDEAPSGVVTGGAVTSTIPNSDVDHPAKAWTWRVSWVDVDGREGLPSADVTPADIACFEDRPVTIQWNTYSGADRYHIYRGRNGLFGRIGTKVPTAAEKVAATMTFKDDGQLPIITRQPRTWDRPYAAFPPATGCFFQDRLCFANQVPSPSDIRLSYAGDYQGFDEKKDFASPADALLFRLASRRYEEVRALVPLGDQLIALTSEQEWLIGGAGGGDASGAVSFSNFGMKPVSSNGCAWVQPVVVGGSIVYIQSTGNVVRAVGKDSAEVSLLASHLFTGYTVKEVHYAAVPYSVVWFVRSDGALVSLAYQPETKSFAWGLHTFKDEFGAAANAESATVVRESGEDVLWLVMYRPNNGTAIRTIERMAPRAVASVNASTFLDCSVTGSGTSVACAHFTNGRTVTYFADGVKGTAVVTGGAVTVPSCTRAVVGLPISAYVTSLSSQQAITEKKVVPRVWVETDAAEWSWSSAAVGVKAGNDTGGAQDTVFVKNVTDGLIEILIDTVTNPGGRVTVQLDDPIPVEIRGIIREVVPGQ